MVPYSFIPKCTYHVAKRVRLCSMSNVPKWYEINFYRDKMTRFWHGDASAWKRSVAPEVRRRLSRSCGHLHDIAVNPKVRRFRKRPSKRELSRERATGTLCD
ncbi:hypothetical protein Y032_0003g1262 [Ancylostoma ceylanicum]|uniref:Uncharacterized protein n=1 Tax=Ancylostoma ceylanicum TaxID=53326 RepID=A0A016VWW6_9BILA|nr:hypothetical protein Y032_0003g1262 [Ancylostoma ceylanicum]